MTRKRPSEALEAIPAPSHLSARAAALWANVVPHRARTIARQALVQTALEALDRADAARRILDEEGMVITPARGMPHVHPLTKVEKDARAQFASIWRGLNLDWNSTEGNL